MERTKRYTIAALLLVFSLFKLPAQYKQDIYNAYINSNMDAWKGVIDKMEQKQDKDEAFLLELVNYQYGYIGYSMNNSDKKQANKYLKLAKNNLEELEKTTREASYIYAYESAFYGFSVGLSRLKAPFLGPKSVKAAQEAMETDPFNPYGFIQYANAQFYMPTMFGGSKEEAIEYYKRAQVIMEKSPTKIKNNWNYLDLLSKIAESFTIMEQFEKAKAYYQLILEVEPNFLLVKNELYPNIIKRIDNEKE